MVLISYFDLNFCAVEVNSIYIHSLGFYYKTLTFTGTLIG